MGRISIIRLVIGFIFTWIFSLSGHTIPLELLGVPFPSVSAITPAMQYAINLVFVLGIIALIRYSSLTVGRSFLKQWLAYSFIMNMLTETLFRSAFMNGYCTSAIMFTLIGNIPNILVMTSVCGMAVAAAPKAQHAWQKLVAGAIIAAVGMFGVAPAFTALVHPVMRFMSGLAPTGAWCVLPYGPDVLIPAYLTFLEPAFACFAVALLMWDHLPEKPLWRISVFTVIILAARKQLITATLYAMFAKGHFADLFVSMGQFSLEALLLGALSIIALDWAITRPASQGGTPIPAGAAH